MRIAAQLPVWTLGLVRRVKQGQPVSSKRRKPQKSSGFLMSAETIALSIRALSGPVEGS
jgi:hypothetical protein